MSLNTEADFLHAMQQHLDDTSLRLAFADWLEKRGDARGELIRLLRMLTQSVEVPDRPKLEERLRGLLASGVQPVGPFWTNSIGMKFAWIPAGVFMMGSPESEVGREANEAQHEVTFAKGFYMAIYPVTQACWKKVMGDNPAIYPLTQACWQKVKGDNPSGFQGDDLPVEKVSWVDCRAFLRKLSKQDGHSYRLPTEEEWEYACRAGTTTPFYFGATITSDQANYEGRKPYGKGKKGIYRGKTTPVGTFPPNAWGLYDMHGNVDEWCSDRALRYYRIKRGGAFCSQAVFVRSAYRSHSGETDWGDDMGFRVLYAVYPEEKRRGRKKYAIRRSGKTKRLKQTGAASGPSEVHAPSTGSGLAGPSGSAAGAQMEERLYPIKNEPALFETGMAQGKQLLLANTVSEILLHWFAPSGEFLELERFPIPAQPPGGTVWDVKTGKVISERLGYWERVEREKTAIKQRIGFVSGDIAVRKFQSEEACIEDLPGEYEEFLMKRDEYSEEDQQAFDGYIKEWRSQNCFVLEFTEQYWMSAEGEVEHS